MKRILMLCMFLTVLITCVSCAQPAQTTEAPSETTPTVAITTTEPAYYFQTVDNFVELKSDFRGPSHIFRHEEESYGQGGTPTFSVSAEIPATITLNGVAYALKTTPRTVMTRSVRVAPIDADPYGIYTSLTQFVGFDAIDGTLTEFYGFEVEKLSDTQKEMAPVDLAKAMIAKYLPHVPVEQYELFSDSVTGKNYDEVFLGTVSFRRYIKGYSTTETLNVTFHLGSLCGIVSTTLNSNEDLDLSALDRIDKEDTEKIIDSLIEYVRNGHKIVEPELWSKMIVLMPDGRYAIQYDIIIRLDDPEFPWSDRISACIYLDDSKAE